MGLELLNELISARIGYIEAGGKKHQRRAAIAAGDQMFGINHSEIAQVA